jgi:hypothetical protein
VIHAHQHTIAQSAEHVFALKTIKAGVDRKAAKVQLAQLIHLGAAEAIGK